MPSSSNRAVIAAAGSGKTEYVIEQAVAATGGRVLITTYTRENLRQLTERIAERCGGIPQHITLMTWYDFLVNQCARPYQSAWLGAAGIIGSLNFVGRAHKFARRDQRHYYFDSNNDMYPNGVAVFVCEVNNRTGGLVMDRLAGYFSSVFVDEVQDLVGYDLDLLDLLFKSPMAVTVVGDPRQHTFATNQNMKNKKFRGRGFVLWLKERETICQLEERNESVRCNQAICDFADRLFPEFPPTVSKNRRVTEHDGVFTIPLAEVPDYVTRWRPTVLRENISYDTAGLAAINIGIAKGSTFDRVLVFGNKPMTACARTRDPSKTKQPDRMYVAVTRARFSATFVEGVVTRQTRS